MKIATHTSPDLDAIGAFWLLKRFHPDFKDAEIAFVPAGQTAADADAVVDTGGEYHPSRLRFDHHHFANPSETSATALVFGTLNLVDEPLERLVALITDGDGRNISDARVRASYDVGIHALVAQWRSDRMPDAEIVERASFLLDTLYARYQRIDAAAREYEEKAVWKSADNEVILLVDAPASATWYAYEREHKIVIFCSQMEHTVAVGANRHPESLVHLGEVVECILARDDIPDAVREELQRWYRHPAGFFTGRGSLKSPDPTPCALETIMKIADLIDEYV